MSENFPVIRSTRPFIDKVGCAAGAAYKVEADPVSLLLSSVYYATSVLADARSDAEACAQQLENSTKVPHYVDRIFWGNGYAAYPLDNCKSGGNINGEKDAKTCALELSRITDQTHIAKLVKSHWLWFNEYAIQKK